MINQCYRDREEEERKGRKGERKGRREKGKESEGEREKGRERSSQDTLGSANSIKSDGNTSGIPPTLVLTTCNLKKGNLACKIA